MRPKIDMLLRWQDDPDAVAANTVGLEAKLKDLLSKDDPLVALSTFIDEMLSELSVGTAVGDIQDRNNCSSNDRKMSNGQ